MRDLTPLIETLITFGTGVISLAVLVLVWKIAVAFTTWTTTLRNLGIDVLRIEKDNTSGHIEIRLAVGAVDKKVDRVDARVNDMQERMDRETEG